MADEFKFPGNAGVYVLVNFTSGEILTFFGVTRANLDAVVVRKDPSWKPVNSWFEREPTLENFAVNIGEYCSFYKQQLASARIIDISEIPTDLTFRDAWTHDFAVDMSKAREIHKEHLRRERAPLMAALDVEFIRAVEQSDIAKQAEITTRKQALRDVTARPEIEAARTPEELKLVLLD